MGPFTIDHHFLFTLELHAHAEVPDEILLARVQSECPLASTREIARAALYLSTDPAPADTALPVRPYLFANKVRRIL